MNLLRLFSNASSACMCRSQTVSTNLLTRTLVTAQKPAETQKDAVRELRRRTGYSFSHIKKALEQHNWDVAESEKFLKAEAKRLGWEKATGLASRVSKQGLLGVLESNDGIAMIELNCETDFVAKNKRFHNLLASICHSVVQSNGITQSAPNRKWAEMNPATLSSSKVGSGTIADLIASEVGHIGENIQLRRGLFWPKHVTKDSAIAFMTHPVSTMTAVVETELGPLNVGKYAAIVEGRRVARKADNSGDDQIEQLPVLAACQQLAQHVIGMNPDKIFPEKQQQEVSSLKEPSVAAVEKKTDDDSKTEAAADQTPRDDRALVCQSFVLDEDITVAEFLDEQSLEVVDFVRFEVGEQTSAPPS